MQQLEVLNLILVTVAVCVIASIAAYLWLTRDIDDDDDEWWL